jgi:hypothetical protein
MDLATAYGWRFTGIYKLVYSSGMQDRQPHQVVISPVQQGHIGPTSVAIYFAKRRNTAFDHKMK